MTDWLVFALVAAAALTGVYACMRWADRVGERLEREVWGEAEAGSVCRRCKSSKIYQHARDNGPPVWACQASGWQWPGA
jgi:hypothetical protein